jgi:hypothetical protein
VKYAQRDGHDLDRENTDLVIVVFSVAIGECVDVGEEAGVGTSANANAMNEEDRKACSGCVRPAILG